MSGAHDPERAPRPTICNLFSEVLDNRFQGIMPRKGRFASGEGLGYIIAASGAPTAEHSGMATDTTTSLPRLADAAAVQINAIIQHADKLRNIIEASKKLEVGISADAIVDKFSADFGIKRDSLRAIFTALDQLNSLAQKSGGVDEALDIIVRVFGETKFPGLDAARENIITAVSDYSDDNPIAITVKASRLSHLFERLFLDAEIITDARPVYSADGSSVLEYIINHSLVITYHSDSGSSTAHLHPRIHFALDPEDVVNLRDACDRAVRKGKALHDDLGKKARMVGNADG